VGKPQREVDPYREELHVLRQRLGQRIRELRKLRGWSQEEFSDYAHIHRTFAGSLERGEKNISFHALVLIARCFGMSMTELFEGLENGEERKSPRNTRARTARKSQDIDRDRVLQEAAILERAARSLRDIAGAGPGSKVNKEPKPIRKKGPSKQ
jgi:transcriptional regulator with XRE-family HTH domain